MESAMTDYVLLKNSCLKGELIELEDKFSTIKARANIAVLDDGSNQSAVKASKGESKGKSGALPRMASLTQEEVIQPQRKSVAQQIEEEKKAASPTCCACEYNFKPADDSWVCPECKRRVCLDCRNSKDVCSAAGCLISE